MMFRNNFLRLTHNLVNVSYIKNVEIHKNPPSFKIVIDSPDFEGVVIGGTGFVKHNLNFFNIDKNKNPEDYETVSKWIEKMSET